MNSTETKTEAVVNPCQREISVEVPAEAVSQAWQNTVNQLSKMARLPGFRKGKVPASIVRQRFANDIKSEVAEHLIPQHLREETAKQNLKPISSPQISDLHLEDGEPLRFKATFEVMPEIDVNGYKELKAEKETITVSDEDVQKALDELREQSSTFEPIEDEGRTLADGDFAQISFKSTSGEEGTEPVEMNDVLVHVGDSNTVKEFTENLRGAKANEDRSFDVTYGEDFPEKRLAGKTLHYDVKVLAIKKKVMPELDDEFVKQFAQSDEFKTVEELRARLKENMGKEREHEAEHKSKDKLVDALADKFDFPVPQVLVEQAIDTRLERGLRALAAQGLRAKDMQNLDLSHLREGQREQATKEVKASLVLGKIAEIEKLEITDDELNKQIQMLALQARQAPDAVRAQLEKSGGLERMRDSLLHDKALDLIYQQ